MTRHHVKCCARENRGIDDPRKNVISANVSSEAEHALFYSTTFSTPLSQDDNGKEKEKRRVGGESCGRRTCARSISLFRVRERPQDNASYRIAIQQRGDTARHNTIRYDTWTSDTILGSRLSLTSPRVSRGRGELYPHRRCSGATWSRAWSRGRPPLSIEYV